MINEAEHMCSSDEIEQLKSVHDQLAKDMACQFGIQLALDQKDQIEEHLKFAGSSWDELQHIRQAVGLLLSHQKTQKSMEEITNELCPVLSVPQIYRIGTMFWDDKYGTQGLSQEVRASVVFALRTLLDVGFDSSREVGDDERDDYEKVGA